MVLFSLHVSYLKFNYLLKINWQETESDIKKYKRIHNKNKSRQQANRLKKKTRERKLVQDKPFKSWIMIDSHYTLTIDLVN